MLGIMTNKQTNTPKMEKIHFEVRGLPHEEINQEINISLGFPILCPKCQATGGDIRKDGHETKIAGHPQKWECKMCEKTFMTHTSLFFQEVTQVVFLLAFTEVTQTRSSIKEVANRYNMTPSTLQEFVARVRGILVSKVELVKKILHRENSQSVTQTGLNQAVYIYETFLKIKRSTYYLIVTVNSEGIPLYWKLASSRKNEVIKGVMKEIFHQHGVPKMIITDGNPTYEKVLTSLRYQGIHVIHVHKDKRNRIIIRRCVFKDDSAHYFEELVGLNHDVFITEGTKFIWILSSQKKLSQKRGKRGRPKGSKNPFKTFIGKIPSIFLLNTAQKKKLSSKRRDLKNVFTTGVVMEIRVNPVQKSIEIIAPILSVSEVNPSLNESLDPFQVLSLLYPVFQEFKGHSISSNRIENLFSQLDYLFIPRGRRTVTSVTNETSTWLFLR